MQFWVCDSWQPQVPNLTKFCYLGSIFKWALIIFGCNAQSLKWVPKELMIWKRKTVGEEVQMQNVMKSILSSSLHLKYPFLCNFSAGTVELNVTGSDPASSETPDVHAAENSPIHIDGIVPSSRKAIPRLKIAMIVVGTRGDVQPFLAVARGLQACLNALFYFIRYICLE
ncbi:hypothetical protein Cgig2_006794 [Carnegiea gigantea]|uniref:Sterol 3-beta-glucosyltransferase n=1 Tax=Carnegiea gigantea TaxID=171969 RepID=A0A9Q1GZ69_9CARY|nr:hypothetical protein Cgig2_006794 [Carnegiea gigantea]